MAGNPGFWRQFNPLSNQQVALGRTFGFINNVHYIFPQGGGPRGAYSTFAEVSPNLQNRDLIILSGVLREQALAPLGVFDVTITGAANRPRQATSSGVPTGGGAFWTYPTATTPVANTALLTLREQAWQVLNLCMTAYTSSPCIEAIRAESATYPDPSHLSIDGCRFVGGTTAIGYRDSGGCNNVSITNSIFQALTHGIKGIAGAGIADCLANEYLNNYFFQNVNDIVISCSYGRIMNNVHKLTTTKKVSLTAGGHETVQFNSFDDLAADIDPAHGYDGSATGSWANYTLNQAALQVGQPA